MSVLHPSPALMIPGDRTIGDCVREMRNRNIGSILVVEDMWHGKKWPQTLIGIFTERDLLKYIDEIQHGGFWDKPVRAVMSKPVLTLPIAQFDQAAALMLEKGIRHLPIVQPRENGPEELLGLVSMRDLLRIFVDAGHRLEIESKLTVGVVTADPRDFERSKALLSGVQAQVEKVEPVKLKKDTNALPSGLQALLIDLDHQDAQEWPLILKSINHATNVPLTIVLFDPILHSDNAVEALNKLRDASKFAVFAKPANILKLIGLLRAS